MTSQTGRSEAHPRADRIYQIHRPDQRCPLCGSLYIVEMIYDGEAVFTVIRPRCRCHMLTP